MEKGQPVWLLIGAQGGLVHQAANRKVRPEQAVELLPHQFRRLAAQNDLSPAQVRLQFIQCRLSGKGLARC